MPIPYRRELTAFLDEFAAHHRGVRRGQMFGLPAIYVGRRLCACLFEEGLLVRLPSDIARREIASGARPQSRRGGSSGAWIRYAPRSVAAARRLTPVLEISVRHVARQQAAGPRVP
jgi:hypothetical protein